MASEPAQPSQASAGPLDADGLERRLLHLLLLIRLLLLLCQRLALLHGLARRALVVVGLTSGRAALLDDIRLGGLQPMVGFRADLHAVALARDGVDGNRASAVAD